MKYFMMSMHFNKSKPEDFGLKVLNSDTYIDDEGTKWKPLELYDFGWGPENGYYRLPMLSFKDLFIIGSHDDDMINKYGSASVILEKYADELLDKVEYLISQNEIHKYIDFLKILKLDLPMNRSNTKGLTYKEIKSYANRWKKITDTINKY